MRASVYGRLSGETELERDLRRSIEALEKQGVPRASDGTYRAIVHPDALKGQRIEGVSWDEWFGDEAKGIGTPPWFTGWTN